MNLSTQYLLKKIFIKINTLHNGILTKASMTKGVPLLFEIQMISIPRAKCSSDLPLCMLPFTPVGGLILCF